MIINKAKCKTKKETQNSSTTQVSNKSYDEETVP